MKKLFFGTVKGGKIKLDKQDRLNELICSLEGREIELTLGKKTKHRRSTPQNKYYWGVVVDIISHQLGYSPDETHDALRMLFLMDKTGKVPRIKSTTELTTIEFEDYLSRIRQWASEFLRIYIPEPNEVEL